MNGKKYFKLTLQDLREHPIWVRAMDVVTFSDSEKDDWDAEPGLVVPLPDDPKLVEQLFENCICWARARLQDSSGRTFIGLVKCWAGDGVDGCNPTIALESGQLSFFFAGVKPNENQIAEVYKSLVATPTTLFPLTYRVDVALPGGPPNGVLEGFYWFEYEGEERVLKWVH